MKNNVIENPSLFGWLIVNSFLIVTFVSSYYIQLDQGIPASGKIVVEGNRKEIVHQSGGVVDQIFIKNGDFVRSNQVLISFNKTTSKANMKVYEEQKKSLKDSVDHIQESISSKRNERELIKERIKSYTELVNKGFLSSNYLSEYKQKFELCNSDLSAKLAQLSDAKGKLHELNERIDSSGYEVTQMDIKSPVSGVVMDLKFNTVGAFIPPATKIMDIVPSDANFVAEILIPVNLIDKVTLGNKVELSFPSLDRSKTPRLKAKLKKIDPDSITSNIDGSSYFTAQAEIADQNEINKLSIKLGMPAEVFIKTGDRSLISYLLKPISDKFKSSLN